MKPKAHSKSVRKRLSITNSTASTRMMTNLTPVPSQINRDYDAHDAVLQSYNTGKTPKLESYLSNAALGAPQVQKGTSPNFLVRVTSYRKRLLDEDNLCEKYHVDLCRYAGIIPGDQASETKIEVRQKKVGKTETEKILIEVFKRGPL